jgi:hypothetical protein
MGVGISLRPAPCLPTARAAEPGAWRSRRADPQPEARWPLPSPWHGSGAWRGGAHASRLIKAHTIARARWDLRGLRDAVGAQATAARHPVSAAAAKNGAASGPARRRAPESLRSTAGRLGDAASPLEGCGGAALDPAPTRPPLATRRRRRRPDRTVAGRPAAARRRVEPAAEASRCCATRRCRRRRGRRLADRQPHDPVGFGAVLPGTRPARASQRVEAGPPPGAIYEP